jgi:hypothetical protein
MKCNVGGRDRTARLGIGSALLAAGILAPMGKAPKLATLLAGATTLLTGLSHYCPASDMFGRSTCGTSNGRA